MVADTWVVEAVRELTLLELVLATGVLLLGGVLKGTTGFAVGLVTIAGVVQFFPPRAALVALSIPFLASNVLVLAREGVPWSFLRTQTGFLLTLTVGLFVGVTSLGALSQSAIYLLLAGYVGLFLIVQRYDELVERYADSAVAGGVAGGLAGVLGGIVSAPGPPLVVHSYLEAGGSRDLFVVGTSSLFLVAHAVRLAFLTEAGLLGGREVALGVGFTLPIFAGVVLGSRVRPHVDAGAFETLVKGLLLVIGVRLLATGLGW